MPRNQATNPITVAFARKSGCRLIIDCPRCAYHEVVGLDGFGQDELVVDLHKRRTWSCPRCGGTMLETRPQYPAFGEAGEHLVGLEQK